MYKKTLLGISILSLSIISACTSEIQLTGEDPCNDVFRNYINQSAEF